MAGLLSHSPARIIGQLLIDNGYGSDGEGVSINGPYPTNVWYIFDNREPDKPDNIIKISDTQGRDNGYCQDGEREENPGIQIMVRSVNKREGYYKAHRIATFLDSVNREMIAVEEDLDNRTGTGTSDLDYLIANIERTSNVIPLGSDVPQGKRQLFVINAICYLRACC